MPDFFGGGDQGDADHRRMCGVRRCYDGVRLAFKLEYLQCAGSFKARGAFPQPVIAAGVQQWRQRLNGNTQRANNDRPRLDHLAVATDNAMAR